MYIHTYFIVTSVAMRAPMTHGISKYHLRLAKGEKRIVFLYRKVHQNNLLAAKKHFDDCGNKEGCDCPATNI